MEKSEEPDVIDIEEQEDEERTVDPDLDERVTRILERFEEDFEQLS